MRTLIVSDLHLGSRAGVDLLRRPALREALLGELAAVDRLVLLGDVLELRHGPRREAMAAAQPFLTEVGRAMAGREIVLLAGNHDHALVEPWLRARAGGPQGLEPEQRFEASASSPDMAQMAAWAAPAHLSAAYPGLWLRPDVYATHGHYLDCHLTVPSMERLGLGVMGRVMRRPPSALAGAEDYEAVGGPMFAWIDAVAQHAPTGDALNGQVTVRAWSALRPTGRPRLRHRAARAGFVVAVAGLNRAGLGPLRPRISGGELRRAGLRAMGEVAQRLDLGAGHLIFGHTHRPGPLAADDPAQWTGPSGIRLVNSGCWTYDGWWLGHSAADSPYWPGVAVVVQDTGPPVLRRLLDDRTREELRPPD